AVVPKRHFVSCGYLPPACFCHFVSRLEGHAFHAASKPLHMAPKLAARSGCGGSRTLMISRGFVGPRGMVEVIYVGSQVLSLMHRAPSVSGAPLPLVLAQL